jgi:glycosyltransferase involved in cell wall biosynthesis
MNKERRHVVFIGLSGFPIGMAAIQRQKLLAKSLINQGRKVTIVCTRSTHQTNDNVKKIGRIEGIIYIYLYSPFRKKNFFKRNFQKLFAPIFEFFLLVKLNKKNKIKVGIVSNRNSIVNAIKYFILSKLLRFKLTINLVEIYKERSDTPIIVKWNDYLFNNIGLILFDGFLPISHNIINYYKKFKKPNHLIPVIVNTEAFDRIKIEKKQREIFFLFCGSSSYSKSFEFILEAFGFLKHVDCKLIFVTNGAKFELDRIREFITRNKLENKVFLKKNISDIELYTLYKTATGLLLPLFDTLQDKARFPHKLAEYLASGTVVLSTPIGEITNYLENKKNVLFSEVNNSKAYADNIEWVINNPSDCLKIGQEGMDISRKYFDYKKISAGFDFFLENLE